MAQTRGGLKDSDQRSAAMHEALLRIEDGLKTEARKVVLSEKRILHTVASRTIGAPRHSWRTTCGWKFACGSGDFSIYSACEAEGLNAAFCDKCKPFG